MVLVAPHQVLYRCLNPNSACRSRSFWIYYCYGYCNWAHSSEERGGRRWWFEAGRRWWGHRGSGCSDRPTAGSRRHHRWRERRCTSWVVSSLRFAWLIEILCLIFCFLLFWIDRCVRLDLFGFALGGCCLGMVLWKSRCFWLIGCEFELNWCWC